MPFVLASPVASAHHQVHGQATDPGELFPENFHDGLAMLRRAMGNVQDMRFPVQRRRFIVDPELPIRCWRDQGQVHQGHLETQALEAYLAGRTPVGCEAQTQEFILLPQGGDAICQWLIQGAIQE